MDDAGALLRDQLGEPRNYAAVTSSIAAGYTRMSEIATMSGLQPSNVGKYLDVLQHLGIIVREVPATVSRPERSKQGRYRVVDHYLRFYYRFIAPARSNLERGLIQQAWQNMRQHLSEYVGTFVFEELCREWVLRQGDAGQLPFVPRRVGSFWAAGKPQIDVVAINEDAHAILLGECKWTAEPIRKWVVEDFLKRAPQIIPAPVEAWHVTYALFSKNGFTAEARQAMSGHACLWIDLKQLDQDLRIE
jgi:AAA+ ATPase superfamily predicted ATPase